MKTSTVFSMLVRTTQGMAVVTLEKYLHVFDVVQSLFSSAFFFKNRCTSSLRTLLSGCICAILPRSAVLDCSCFLWTQKKTQNQT